MRNARKMQQPLIYCIVNMHEHEIYKNCTGTRDCCRKIAMSGVMYGLLGGGT